MTTKGFSFLVLAAAGGLALCGAGHAVAQSSSRLPTQVGQTKFDSGQNVVPVYEGWIRNPDDSFDLVFGYFNRNFKEELAIPAGPDNMVEPGGPDRGQPTYFLARRRARLFRVHVPKDWGQLVTWTITVNGRTEKAFGDLLPVQEINEHIIMSGGNSLPFGDEDLNKPPTIAVATAARATVTSPITLTAKVTDDGLPKPRTPLARPTTTTTQNGTIQRQVNSSGAVRPRGLTVTWFQYGGPAKVTFEPTGSIPVTNGTASATARFEAPGTYKLVATANDGQLSERAEVTVTVE